jgi:flavin-dependent dehydrogenase
VTAARSGARVLHLERGSFPRHKVCGEFISPDGLALLKELGLADFTTQRPRIAGTRIFAGTSVAEGVLSPAAAAISRYELDHALWQRAVASGADCRQQIAARALRGTGPFQIETLAGDFTVGAVINASGRWSNLRRSQLPRRPPEKWVGWKAHFREAEPQSSVDLYFFPDGYCGVQPLGNGRVNACAMVRGELANSVQQILALHPSLRERSRGWQQVSETVTTSPLVFAPPEAEERGVLFAGDAGGFIDPFVGDGISLALHSGIMAAEAITNAREANKPISVAAAFYRECYNRQLRPLFRNAGWLRRLTSIPRALHRPVMTVLASPRVTRYLISKTRLMASASCSTELQDEREFTS